MKITFDKVHDLYQDHLITGISQVYVKNQGWITVGATGTESEFIQFLTDLNKLYQGELSHICLNLVNTRVKGGMRGPIEFNSDWSIQELSQ